VTIRTTQIPMVRQGWWLLARARASGLSFIVFLLRAYEVRLRYMLTP
jgi:hypothetical protein